MNKRYQVFVSSTYADLKQERQNVIQALIEMDCIPAGMEIFPAIDEEQWKFIKRIIDDCDYYILIIGGRYGSLTPEGISYTEKEYDYAVSKELKVLAFVHESPDDIPVNKSEMIPSLRKKLNNFRKKVCQGRLVKKWTQAAELPGLVALSLSKTIKLYPAKGWIRATNIANDLDEINSLRRASEARATVIVGPTFPDPLSDPKTPEYAGISYYIVRLDSSRFENWQADHQPTYQLNSQVIDPANNRVYTMNNSKGIENPALAPHENPTDWEISDEIKIEYAEGFDIEGREIPIKDFVPIFPIGASVRITNRTLKDGSTRYLMVGLLPVGGAEERTLAMVNGKISAVFG